MLDYKRTNIRTNQAHNLKVVGSNPTPATIKKALNSTS